MSSNIVCQVRCGICLENYTATDIILGGKCGHLVHGTCLNQWQKHSRECPICRKRNDEYFQIYLDFDADPSAGRRNQPSNSRRETQTPAPSSRSQGQSQRSSHQRNCHHRRQHHSRPNQRFNDNDDDDDDADQFEHLIMQQTLFQSEMEYLNVRIQHLTTNFAIMFDDSD